MNGRVYLVGAGPGDPELLTLKALRVLRSADVVLHDDLVAHEVLQLLPATTIVHNVGKRCGSKGMRQQEINELMVKYARSSLVVVRLKGGDPLIFGRAGEEIAALRAANVHFEIVPGVTAAIGAAAAAGITLTQRHVASAVALVTYSLVGSEPPMDWRTIVASGATVAVYMPGENYGRIARELYQAGLGAETPCLLISCATTPVEQIHSTTVERLADMSPLPAPTLMIVGTVGKHAADRAPAMTESPAVLATGQFF